MKPLADVSSVGPSLGEGITLDTSAKITLHGTPHQLSVDTIQCFRRTNKRPK